MQGSLAPKAKGRFLGGQPKEICPSFCAANLFGEEPKKQRPAVPQGDGF